MDLSSSFSTIAHQLRQKVCFHNSFGIASQIHFSPKTISLLILNNCFETHSIHKILLQKLYQLSSHISILPKIYLKAVLSKCLLRKLLHQPFPKLSSQKPLPNGIKSIPRLSALVLSKPFWILYSNHESEIYLFFEFARLQMCLINRRHIFTGRRSPFGVSDFFGGRHKISNFNFLVSTEAFRPQNEFYLLPKITV